MLTRTETCPHHWDIEETNGRTSTGICKLCGEIRQFSNSIETLDERKKDRRVCGMRHNQRFVDNACEPRSELPVPAPGYVVSMEFYSTKGQRS